MLASFPQPRRRRTRYSRRMRRYRWTVPRNVTLALLAIGLVPGCGKERPFAPRVEELQEQPGPAAAEPANRDAAIPSGSTDCTTDGCDGSFVCDPAMARCVRCLADVDCPAQAPACRLGTDSTTNACVQCTSSVHCNGEAPICDLFSGRCTASCASSADCRGQNVVCDETTQFCVECVDDVSCSGATPRCDTSARRCVQCREDADCSAGVCDIETGTCGECSSAAQCLAPSAPRCEVDPASGDQFHTCVPCRENADCSGKPGVGGLCRATDGRCVECLSDAECAGDPTASTCSADGTCSVCLTDADCAAVPGLGVCLPAVGCVACSDNSDCTGNPSGGICKNSNVGEAVGSAALNMCVECASNSDCTDPNASKCQNNQCVPCATNDDCGHVDSTPNAPGGTALNVCDAGSCVQCTGLQREACGANVCDSFERSCTAFPAGTAGSCEACLSDAHCGSNARCVQQTFGLQSIGFFCFPLVDEAGSCDSNRTFVLPTQSATIDTLDAAVCLSRVATCPAYIDYRLNTVCEGADANEVCGQGGQCGQVPGGTEVFLCSIPCLNDRDCVSGSCFDDLCTL